MNSTDSNRIEAAPNIESRQGHAIPEFPGLPLRDLILLPLLSVLTIVFLLVGIELAARHFFPMNARDACRIGDPNIGFKYRPNCASSLKSAEGPWVVNQYNDCGYRTKESCGIRSPGSVRIALIGSSVAEGFFVGYEETWASRAAKDLTRMCGRHVEVQNLGREQCYPVCMFRRVDEALALKPDLLMMTVAPSDLEHLIPSEIPDVDKPVETSRPSTAASANVSFLKKAKKLVIDSRTVTAVQHYLFQDPLTYSRIYLGQPDKPDFLRLPFSSLWQERLRGFDLLLGAIEDKARAQHVPFILIEIPSPAQVSILTMRNPPPQVDPYALNQRLEEISSRHGIRFVNVLDAFRRTPASNGYFYMVDTHLNAEGQALISAPLVEDLTEGPNPLLSGCLPPQQLNASKNF